MNEFLASLPKKIDKFNEIMFEAEGYVKVVEGLQNTLKIAVMGLIIGILIGTLIATIRVIPKYKVLPRVLNAICTFYVALYPGEDGCTFDQSLFDGCENVYCKLIGADASDAMSEVISVYDLGENGAILYSEVESQECFLAQL